MNIMFIKSDNEASSSDYCIIEFNKKHFEAINDTKFYNLFSQLISRKEDTYEDHEGYKAWNVLMEIWEKQGRSDVPI